MFSFVTQEKKSNIPIFVFEIESIRHFVANLLRLLTSSVISAEEPTSDNGMTDYFFSSKQQILSDTADGRKTQQF